MSEHVNGTVVDLSAVLLLETAVQEMTMPGSEPPRPTGWKVTHAGPGHPKSIALSNKQIREFKQRELEKERAQVNGKNWTGEHIDVAQERRDYLETVVARIVTWTPVSIGGEVFEFSDARAYELLSRPDMIGFAAQMREFQDKQSSFTRGDASP